MKTADDGDVSGVARTCDSRCALRGEDGWGGGNLASTRSEAIASGV